MLRIAQFAKFDESYGVKAHQLMTWTNLLKGVSWFKALAKLETDDLQQIHRWILSEFRKKMNRVNKRASLSKLSKGFFKTNTPL